MTSEATNKRLLSIARRLGRQEGKAYGQFRGYINGSLYVGLGGINQPSLYKEYNKAMVDAQCKAYWKGIKQAEQDEKGTSNEATAS